MSDRYRTICADPPWPYHASRPVGSTKDERPNSYNRASSSPSAAARYGFMSLDAIKSLVIPAEDDAHLYLWATNAFVEEAHQVARAWGFAPKTILTWVKMQHTETVAVSMRMGYYFRGASEHVVFAVRGSLRLNERTLPTAFLWPRVSKHSQKPEQFYDLVERASPGPYLEMFARQRRFGWSSWGNQVASDVTLEVSA